MTPSWVWRVFLSEWGQKKTKYAISLWILFLTFEYWFLGPYSFVGYHDEADLGIVRFLHDTTCHIGGNFLHGVLGGVDKRGTLLTGGQYFSLERGLVAWLPLSLAILIHKVLVTCTSTIGMYLLLRKSKTFLIPRSEAFFLSAFFSTSNIYMIHKTFHYGLGYSVLPLACYLFTLRTNKKYYLFSCFLLSILISISNAPSHTFLAVFFGLITISFLIYRKYINLRFCLAVSFLIFIVCFNWIDAISVIKEYATSTIRFSDPQSTQYYANKIWGSWRILKSSSSFQYLFFKGFSFLPFLIIGLTTAIAIKNKLKFSWPFLLAILTPIYFPEIMYSIPWAHINLTFLNSVNYSRIAHVSTTAFILTLAALPLTIRERGKRIAGLCVFLPFLFFNFDLKIRAFIETIYSNRLKLYAIDNLLNHNWNSRDNLFRVVTAGDWYRNSFHPNFVWNYGLESLDGVSNLVPRIHKEYWYYGLHKNSNSKPLPFTENARLHLHYSDKNIFASTSIHGCEQPFIDLDSTIDLNILRLANVGYVISYFPLKGTNVTKVSGPENQPHPSCLPTFKEKLQRRLKNTFDPDDINIYSLGDFTPRAYFPSKIISDLPLKESYRYISKHYCPRCVFTDQKTLEKSEGVILKLTKVKDGYDIEVDVKKEGLFVLNHFMTPWWQVFINGKKKDIFTINNFQIGLNLKQGKSKLEFRHIIVPLSKKLRKYSFE